MIRRKKIFRRILLSGARFISFLPQSTNSSVYRTDFRFQVVYPHELTTKVDHRDKERNKSTFCSINLDAVADAAVLKSIPMKTENKKKWAFRWPCPRFCFARKTSEVRDLDFPDPIPAVHFGDLKNVKKEGSSATESTKSCDSSEELSLVQEISFIARMKGKIQLWICDRSASKSRDKRIRKILRNMELSINDRSSIREAVAEEKFRKEYSQEAEAGAKLSEFEFRKEYLRERARMKGTMQRCTYGNHKTEAELSELRAAKVLEWRKILQKYRREHADAKARMNGKMPRCTYGHLMTEAEAVSIPPQDVDDYIDDPCNAKKKQRLLDCVENCNSKYELISIISRLFYVMEDYEKGALSVKAAATKRLNAISPTNTPRKKMKGNRETLEHFARGRISSRNGERETLNARSE